MSEVKVNKITPTTDCGTVTLGDSGDTVAIPAGVTLTSGGALQNSGTITNTGTITGVAITGTIDNQVNWQTTVKTTGFTATAGEGYFCDTTSAAFTVTLPASPSAGDLVGIKDYANTADTNNITIGRNGSNIEGVANDFVIEVEGGSITLIYVDATKGWLSTAAAKASDISESGTFITATGGTVVTCGNFKTHIFTGPGTFCVSAVGNPAGGPNTVDYFVVAGGSNNGAGGFRLSNVHSLPSPTTSPLANPSGIAVTAQGYPVTVGAGGSFPAVGSCSVFSTITSARGGTRTEGSPSNTITGGSGGGGGAYVFWSPQVFAAGSGNTPPVSPPQGNNGGSGSPAYQAGGGGGATATGTPATSQPGGGPGGNGATSAITGSPVTRGGGGGGSSYQGGGPNPGGTGGGGAGTIGGPAPNAANGVAGTANTGGGGGGGERSVPCAGGKPGGSGIIIIRYKFQ